MDSPISIVIKVASLVVSHCQDVSDSRAVVEEIRKKMDLVVDTLKVIDSDPVDPAVLQEVKERIDKILQIVKKGTKVSRFQYFWIAKELRKSATERINQVVFLLNAIDTNQLSCVQTFIQSIDAVDNDESLKKRLQEEEGKREKLEKHISELSNLYEELQQFGISSQTDIHNFVHEILEEEEQSTKNQQQQKTQKEEMLMGKLTKLLHRAEATCQKEFLNESIIPDCPVLLETLVDPVIVQGNQCACCVSRKAYNKWIKSHEERQTVPNCPRCNGPLLSRNVFPNTSLAEMIDNVMKTKKASNGCPSFDSGVSSVAPAETVYADMSDVYQSPPVDGLYVSPDGGAVYINFSPFLNGIGWEIRGQWDQLKIVRGEVSISYEVYWVERHIHPGQFEIETYHFSGRFTPTGGLVLFGSSTPLELTPISKLQSNGIHYMVGCDGCGSNPIAGIRYSVKGKSFDLCGACMACFDELDPDNTPEKREFEAIIVPESNPHTLDFFTNESLPEEFNLLDSNLRANGQPGLWDF